MLLSLDVVVVLETILCQHFFHLDMWARCNLVNHRPREGHLCFVLQIVEEGNRHASVSYPTFSVCKHACLHLVAIVRAVVHTLHGKWQLSCLEALIEQSCYLTHCQHWLKSAVQVGWSHTVALLRDGEGNHLQRWIAENLHESLPVAELIVCLQCLSDRSNDFLLDGARRLKAYEQREVVVRSVCLVDYIEVECLCHDNTTVVLARVECIVEDGSWECTEDVATAEMHPCRLVMSFLDDCLSIKLRKLITLGFPFAGIVVARNQIIEFHCIALVIVKNNLLRFKPRISRIKRISKL